MEIGKKLTGNRPEQLKRFRVDNGGGCSEKGDGRPVIYKRREKRKGEWQVR